MRPTAPGPSPPPVRGARTARRRSSRGQQTRLSAEPTSPRAPASPVCGRLLHPREVRVRYCHPTPLRTWHQSRPGLCFFNAGKLRGEEKREGRSLGPALRLQSRARRLQQEKCGEDGGRGTPGEERRAEVPEQTLSLRGPTFLPQGPRGAADPGVARVITDSTYLEFEEFQ